MELIMEELKSLRKEIAQSKQPQNTFFELPEGIHLPLKSVEEIDSMEKNLEVSQTLFGNPKGPVELGNPNTCAETKLCLNFILFRLKK